MGQLMKEVFGLEISEGAIANLLLHVKQQLSATVNGIVTRLRQARVIGSDETSARVNGVNQWEWTFQNDEICLHVIRPSRGGDVMTEVLAGHCPEVWISDLFSAQKTHPAEGALSHAGRWYPTAKSLSGSQRKPVSLSGGYNHPSHQ
jgi:transposase